MICSASEAFLVGAPSQELGDCPFLGRSRVRELGACPKSLGACPKKPGARVAEPQRRHKWSSQGMPSPSPSIFTPGQLPR